MPQELDENTDCRLMWEVKILALCLRNFLKHYLLKTRAAVGAIMRHGISAALFFS